MVGSWVVADHIRELRAAFTASGMQDERELWTMLVEMTGDDASKHRRLCSRAPVIS